MAAIARAGNPIFPGHYADPDVAIFANKYWIYPTYSAAYEKETFLDAFSSPDLVHWQKHEQVLDISRVKWAHKAMWAPCIANNNGRYYLFFSANDIHPGELGGIGVAVADSPGGPFSDLLGKPLIREHINGAQPIDQAVFQDPAGQWFIVYGGWGHCNLARLKPDFTGLLQDADGSVFQEITPATYKEAPIMFFRDGKCYFMWSEGSWGDATYQVAYAWADSPRGPFERIGSIFLPKPEVASSAGHHSVLQLPDRDEYYIVYHRRPPGETSPYSRVTCIDRMIFNPDGTIQPVTMTNEGVEARPLRR